MAEAEILDRSGTPVTVPVWHWGATQRVALGASANERGFARQLDDGSWQIDGALLPSTSPGDRLAFADPSNSLSTAPTQASGGIAGVVSQAGPFVWPIMAIALLGLVIIGDRILAAVALANAAKPG